MAEPPKEPTPQQAQPEAPKKRRRRRGVRNPGFFDDRQQEFKKVADFKVHNGGKFDFSYTPVDQTMKAATIHFKAAMDVATVPNGLTVDTGLKLKTEGQTHEAAGAMDQSFGPSGSYVYKYDKKTTCKASFKGTDEFNLNLNRKEGSACYTAKYLVDAKSTNFVASHMRNVHPLWSLGAELKHTQDVSSAVGLTAKFKQMFKGENGEKQHRGHAATLDLSSVGSMQATYTYKYDPNMSLATIFSYERAKGTSSASAAVRYDYDSFLLQAKVTPSDGTIQAALESRINSAISTHFTGKMNHLSGESLFGIGLGIKL